jgi:D-inositol-3-phosphate glycosyltransferase
MLEKRLGIIMYQTSTSKGQELVAQRMVRDFNVLGRKAYLITSTYHDGYEIAPTAGLLTDKGYYCIEDEVLRIPVIRVGSSLAKWPPRRIVFQDFFSTLNQIVGDFGLNVLITHSTLWNGPEETAKFVAWRRDMKQVGGYQDPIVFCHMSHFQEPSLQRYSISELAYRTAWNKVSLSKILEVANLILAVTPQEKVAKIKMGARSEKCLLYPGGVDNEVFLRFAAEDTAGFLSRYAIAPGKRIVSYLGTLEDRKNPAAVLKVAQSLQADSRVHFILAGQGDSTYGREIIDIASTLPNVTYLGEIDERDKALLIRSSHLNILMSKLEALGISQLEFMYGGVPVITSGVGGQAWVVQQGVEGLHLKGPMDIAGAAEAIVRLIEDENLYRQMSANAKAKAARYASINLTGELDAAINRELLEEAGLAGLPRELRNSLVKPEFVLKSWSSGTSGIVATNRRLFIRRGLVSKSVLGMRYRNIKAIEHTRRLPWKVPITGAALSCLAFFAPSWLNFLSESLVTKIKWLVGNVLQTFPAEIISDGWLLALLPFLVSLIIFLIQARVGFHLFVDGVAPVYLPGKFRQAVEFIRNIQDEDTDKVVQPGSDRDEEDSIIDSDIFKGSR